MPRYFFHLSGTTSHDDRVGRDLADLQAAWSQAISSTGELLRDLDGTLPDHSEILTSVTDEHGTILISLRILAEKHTATGQGQPG